MFSIINTDKFLCTVLETRIVSGTKSPLLFLVEIQTLLSLAHGHWKSEREIR
jgi:hypothetical protein